MNKTLTDGITARINDHVAELRVLCRKAEDAADRSDATTYGETVERIEAARAQLQQWYRSRRSLAQDAEGKTGTQAA